MSKRKRRDDEAEDAGRRLADPVRRAAPERRMDATRSSVRAARVRREVAAELPDVLFSRPDEQPPKPKGECIGCKAEGERTRVGQQTARAKAAVREPAARKGLAMPRERPTCKSRPTSNRGAGGSRAFVPWCKR